MPFSSSDLSYVYSGGSDNIDPNQSLGGMPSLQPIVGVIDNLFDDISGQEITDGRTDYRCFYVFNDNLNTSLTGSSISILNQVAGGANAYLGFLFQDDVQEILVSPSAMSGSFSLSWEDQALTIPWSSIPDDIARSITAQVQDFPGIDSVTVVVSSIGLNTLIRVTFSGHKYRELFRVAVNDLTCDLCSNQPQITITKIQDGSPINSVAEEISSSTTTPTSIVFTNPTVDQPIVIGTLHPSDGFPVWIKRISDPNVAPIDEDGLTIRVTGIPQVIAQTASYVYGAFGGISISGNAISNRLISSFSTTSIGGISVSGNALSSYAIITNTYEYTSTGGITISGGSGTSLEVARICYQCCRTGTLPEMYYVSASWITTPSTDPSGCVSTGDQPTQCGCYAFTTGMSLSLDLTTCTWYGTDSYASWTLWQDEATGIWTIEGCANGYEVWTQWDSLNWKCCDLNDQTTSISGVQTNSCHVNGEDTGGNTATITVQPACLADDGLGNLIPQPYDPSNPGDTQCTTTPCSTGNATCDSSLKDCDYCCLPSHWNLTLANLPTECGSANTTFTLKRGAGCTWTGTSNGVTFTLSHTSGTWSLSSTGAAILSGSLPDASFAVCENNTIPLQCSANTGASPTGTLVPEDCLANIPGGGISVSGCAEYEFIDCVPCSTLSTDHWPTVYWTGYAPLGTWSGATASPGSTFPIYINRTGGTGACSCSLQAITTGSCGTTAPISTDNCVTGVYIPAGPDVTFACNQPYTNVGIEICPSSPSASIKYCLVNPVGCFIDPAYQTFGITVT